VFWVISVYFNIKNTPSKSGTFLLGHSVYAGQTMPKNTNDDGAKLLNFLKNNIIIIICAHIHINISDIR